MPSFFNYANMQIIGCSQFCGCGNHGDYHGKSKKQKNLVSALRTKHQLPIESAAVGSVLPPLLLSEAHTTQQPVYTIQNPSTSESMDTAVATETSPPVAKPDETPKMSGSADQRSNY